jgi:hypothetical protein
MLIGSVAFFIAGSTYDYCINLLCSSDDLCINLKACVGQPPVRGGKEVYKKSSCLYAIHVTNTILFFKSK